MFALSAVKKKSIYQYLPRLGVYKKSTIDYAIFCKKSKSVYTKWYNYLGFSSSPLNDWLSKKAIAFYQTAVWFKKLKFQKYISKVLYYNLLFYIVFSDILNFLINF